MLLAQLCNIIHGQTNCPVQSFAGIEIDSRRIQPGQLFVAIQGQYLDGHDFLEEAFNKGAAAALVTQPIAGPYVQVLDTTVALGQIASYHRQQFDIPCIAVTGSCGKTTVKEMMCHILRDRYRVLGTVGNLNNHIGVPLTLLGLTAEHDIMVLELGANGAGDIAHIAAMAQPDIAIINNIANAHLAGFKDEYGIASAKSEIFQYTKPTGLAIINTDTLHVDMLKHMAGHLTIQTFGTAPEATYCIEEHYETAYGSQCMINTPKGSCTVELQVPGLCHVYNAAAAIAATIDYMDLSTIVKRLQSYQGVAGRLNLIKLSDHAYIIDDTYNACPYATEQALKYLSKLPGKKIFVLGDMRELGTQAESLHRHIGEIAKQLTIDICYTYGELSLHTSDAFGTVEHHYKRKDRLLAALKEHLKSQVYILIKGSRAMGMESLIRGLLASQTLR